MVLHLILGIQSQYGAGGCPVRDQRVDQAGLQGIGDGCRLLPPGSDDYHVGHALDMVEGDTDAAVIPGTVHFVAAPVKEAGEHGSYGSFAADFLVHFRSHIAQPEVLLADGLYSAYAGQYHI